MVLAAERGSASPGSWSGWSGGYARHRTAPYSAVRVLDSGPIETCADADAAGSRPVRSSVITSECRPGTPPREQSLSHVAPIEDGHLVSDEPVADGVNDLLTVTFGKPHGGGAGHWCPRRQLELGE